MTETSANPQANLTAVATAQHEGDAWWWMNGLAIIKLRASDTGGQMTIIEVTEPPGEVAPLHVHHHEDETFWLLDGSVTFQMAGREIEARPGDLVFGPRGIPHSYTVGADGCRTLFILTPGGFEELVEAMSRPALDRTLPPHATEEPDWERITEIAARRGNEILE
jgi:quercetin dioxygenase-like cupin family protein